MFRNRHCGHYRGDDPHCGPVRRGRRGERGRSDESYGDRSHFYGRGGGFGRGGGGGVEGVGRRWIGEVSGGWSSVFCFLCAGGGGWGGWSLITPFFGLMSA